jgi:membrane-associated phospholipid phosphatase
MKLRDLIRALALVGGAVAVGRYSATTEGREVDRELFSVANAGSGPAADRFFAGVTELGSLYAAGSAAAALGLAGRRRAAARALAAAGTTWLVLQGVKRLASRSRPYESDPSGTRRMIAEPKGTSWPSSHPAVLTAFTRVASRDLGMGAMARGALGGLDLSVAVSRVYLGVHYPSDVVGGLLLGRAAAHVWPADRDRGRSDRPR